MDDLAVLAVVLAAGNSSRMGTSKMALSWGLSTVLETTISNVLQADIQAILLVTGGYIELVEPLPLVQQIPRVHNGDFATGEMISSVKLALKTIKESRPLPAGVLVLPGDMPLVSTDLLNRCLAEWRQQPEKIVAPKINEKRGHPVIFPFSLFELFETLPAEKSPRDLLTAQRSNLYLFSVDDPAIRIDVDTPAEYEKHRPKK